MSLLTEGDGQRSAPRVRTESRHDGDHSSSPQHDGLLEAITAVWESMRDNGFWDGAIGLQRGRMHAVTAMAAEAGILPERLLSLIKESWRAQPEVAWATHRFLADERRDQIITLCIEEYYARRTTDDGVAPRIPRT